MVDTVLFPPYSFLKLRPVFADVVQFSEGAAPTG